MPAILSNFAPAVLAETIEQNGVECCLSWSEWPRMEFGRSDHLAWTLTDIPFPFFNNVFNARLPKSDIGSSIEETVNRFRQRGAPMFWWTGPTTRPTDLGNHLEDAGFEHGFEAPAMAVDLEGIDEPAFAPTD